MQLRYDTIFSQMGVRDQVSAYVLRKHPRSGDRYGIEHMQMNTPVITLNEWGKNAPHCCFFGGKKR